MKTLSYLKTISVLLVVIFIAFSCSTTKKTALNCPELPRSNANIKAASTLKRHNKTLAFSQKESKRRHAVINRVSLAKKNQETKINVPAEINNQTSNISVSHFEEISLPDKIEYNNNLIASVETVKSGDIEHPCPI